jgi:hypothetical protein
MAIALHLAILSLVPHIWNIESSEFDCANICSPVLQLDTAYRYVSQEIPARP